MQEEMEVAGRREEESGRREKEEAGGVAVEVVKQAVVAKQLVIKLSRVTSWCVRRRWLLPAGGG